MSLVSTDSTVRIEEPGTYKVHDGSVVVTDVNGSTAYESGDYFTVPASGGASVYALIQTIFFEAEKPEPKKKAPAKKAPAKKAAAKKAPAKKGSK